MLKYYVEVIIRNLLKIFYILPVKKQILFESFNGKSVSCNPYYIYKEFEKECYKVKIIWTYNKEIPVILQNKKIKIVRFHSLSWLFASMQSKVIINNDSFGLWVPYRKNQILINTWHGGGAYKKVGNSDNSFIGNKSEYLKNQYFSKITTYFISSCNVFTKVIAESFGISEHKFLEIGMPRNDIFFNKNEVIAADKKVRTFYSLDENDYIVLYAPTFRGSARNCVFNNMLDFNELKNTICKLYKRNVIIMYRGHHLMKNNLDAKLIDIDATSYVDMQELLCSADMLITDYSSCMWDFSFTEKPCILYTPDIDDYILSRGFYTEPITWGFPIAKNNFELKKIIEEFDLVSYKNNLHKNKEYFNNFEKGIASRYVYKIVKDNIDL